MAREPVSRPVSGEILTQRTNRSGIDFASDRDVVEAEYETVVGRYQKLDRTICEAAAEDASPFSLDVFTGDNGDSRTDSAGPAFWLIGALLVVGAFWISGGHSLMPAGGVRTASVQPNPLTIEHVHSSIEKRGGQAFLLVDGSVANNGSEMLALPDLIIQVKLVDGSITRYRIAGGTEMIVAGGRYVFSSRLGAPEAGVENVKVIMQGGN